MKRLLKILVVAAVLYPVVTYAVNFVGNTMSLGDGTASNKKIILNRGSSNAQMRWNESTSRLEFSNDGTTFSALGAGAGGSAGINLLTNGGFESGTTEWSASAGTFTTTSTAANVGNGLLAGSWTPAASTNTLTTSQKTIVSGLYGRNCLAKVLYKKTANNADHTLKVIDGSSNELASVALGQAATYNQATVSFVCPTSGTLAVQVVAGGTDQIFLDEVQLGENFLVGQISQASFYGGATWAIAASCNWATTSSSFGNYSADSDCTTPTGSNLQGNAIAPATKVPGIRFSSLPPGRYYVTATGNFDRSSVNTPFYLRFSDGTNSSPEQRFSISSATSVSAGNFSGWFTYTAAQGDTTIQIQAKNADGTTSLGISASDAPLDIQVYRFPLSTDTAYRPDQTGWYVDANISSSTNPSLGSGTVSSYTEITDSNSSISANSGSLSVQIPCSSTNASTGATCSVGSESMGVVYNQPVAGPVLACASFAHIISLNSAAASADATFQIVETPNNAQTISREGGSRLDSGIEKGNTGVTQFAYHPLRVCGIFNFTSAGQKTLRLMYEQPATVQMLANEITIDGSTSRGQRDMHWEVYPISQQAQQPIIVNSVTSNGAGPWRTEAALISNSGTCGVSTQSGTWISSASHPSTGKCALTFAAGAFSAAPWCQCSVSDVNSDRGCSITSAATTSGITITVTNEAGTVVDNNFTLNCMGAK